MSGNESHDEEEWKEQETLDLEKGRLRRDTIAHLQTLCCRDDGTHLSSTTPEGYKLEMGVDWKNTKLGWFVVCGYP